MKANISMNHPREYSQSVYPRSRVTAYGFARWYILSRKEIIVTVFHLETVTLYENFTVRRKNDSV